MLFAGCVNIAFYTFALWMLKRGLLNLFINGYTNKWVCQWKAPRY